MLERDFGEMERQQGRDVTQVEPKDTRVVRKGRVWAWALLAVLVIVAAGVGGAWVGRAVIAQSLAQRWCGANGVDCVLAFDRIDFDRVEVSSLTVTSGDVEAITADRIALDLDWTSLFAPSVTAVEIDGAAVGLRLRGDVFDAYGLEKLIPESSGGGGSVPTLTLRDIEVELATDAGTLVLEANAEGQFPLAFEVRARMLPANLVNGASRADVEGGEAVVRWTNGVPEGQGRMTVRRLELDSVTVNAFTLNMNAAPVAGREGVFRVGAEGRAGELAVGARRMESANFDILLVGQAPEDGSRARLIGAAESLQFSAQAFAVTAPEGSAQSVIIDGSLTLEAGGAIAGPVLVAASGIVSEPLSADTFNLDGEASLVLREDAVERAALKSGVVVRGGVIGSGPLGMLAALNLIPKPIDAHGRELGAAVWRGLSSFDTGLHTSMRWSQADGPDIEVTRPAQLTTASGMELTLTPNSEAAWFIVRKKKLMVAADIVLTGGGGPTLRTSVRALELPLEAGSGSDVRFEAAPFYLEPWTADGLTVGLRADRVSFRSSASEAWRASGIGELTLDGKTFGLELKDVALFGGVEALRGAAGWQVRMQGTDCLALSAAGLRSGELTLRPETISVCPPDGQLLRRQGAGFVGQASLGQLGFGIESPNMSAQPVFQNAMANWSLTDYFTLDLTADRASLPATLPEGDVRLETQRPRLTLELVEPAPRFALGLEVATLSGSLIPAGMKARTIAFEGVVEESGMSGQGRFDDVVVSDLADDPLYNPLNIGGTFTLNGGRLVAQSRVALEADRFPIASARLDIDLVTLDGTMNIDGDRLTFVQGGLQPLMISDLVRGLFTEAGGSVRPSAALTIIGGKVTGTGEVDVRDFSFQTFRFGSVSGASGVIRFDDILTLSTLPNQTFTVDEINPGIPLSDGVIVFRLANAGEAYLQGANWPFAGGTLRILPTRWTVQGQVDTVIAELDQVKMSEIVAILKVPDLTATGTASGLFPVVIRGTEVRVEDARLRVDGGGQVRYTGAVGEQAGQAANDAKIAFDALSDFRFSVLEMTVNGNLLGDLTVGVTMSGSNPSVLGGQAINMNISVEGPLIPLANQIAGLSSQEGRARMVMDVLRERAEREGNEGEAGGNGQ